MKVIIVFLLLFQLRRRCVLRRGINECFSALNNWHLSVFNGQNYLDLFKWILEGILMLRRLENRKSIIVVW